MLRLVFWLSAGLCGFLGFLHTGITFVAYQALSPGSIWFAGAGLGMLLLALVNVVAWRTATRDTLLHYGTIAANLAMSVLGLLAVKAVREPQAYAVAASFIGLLIASVFRLRRRAADAEPRQAAT